MTDRDVLKRASEALRESSEPSAEELLKLRKRVLGGAGNVVPLAKAQRRKTLRWVLPLAAAFVAGTALAATPGAWEGMLHGVERFLDIQLLGPAHEAKPAEKPAKRGKGAARQQVPSASATSAEPAAGPAPVVEPAPTDAPAAEAVAAAASARVHDAPSAPKPRRTREAPPKPSAETSEVPAVASAEAPAAAEKPAEPSGPSRDLALYNQAHELHFQKQRYADALRAWETYLALPSPTFTLEARYNRALCLLRLGHFEEARAALRPFAEGRVLGDYRRTEASRLIKALDERR